MSGGELLSLLVNVGVAIYFIWVYPRSVRGKLEYMPRIFTLLNKMLPPLGYALIALSLAYVALHGGGLL